MITTHVRLIVAALLLAGALALQPARAAETYHTCAGFIDSVPATISQQGVWCLRKDLSTNIANGNAIAIDANNVTIDCNGFKLGGLAAGSGSTARGIHAYARQNATVRNCSIRGFFIGIYLVGGAGHLIEDNRLDNNLARGINTVGDNNRVRRNTVYDTGGGTGSSITAGITSTGEISDNTVSGLFVDAQGGSLAGIYVHGAGSQARGNSVSGFDATPVQGGSVLLAHGIYLVDPHQRASDNHVASGTATTLGSGYGIRSIFPSSFCQGNAIAGFNTSITANCISGDNLTAP